MIWARGTVVMVMLAPGVRGVGRAAERGDGAEVDRRQARASTRRCSATARCAPCRPIRATST